MKKKNIMTKKIKVIYIVMAVLVSVILYMLVPKVIARTDLFCMESVQEEETTLPVDTSEKTYKQYINFEYDYLKKIKVLFGTYGGIDEGTLTFEFWDETDNELLYAEEKELLYFEDNEYEEFIVPTAIHISEEHTYYFTMTLDALGDDDHLAIYMVDADEEAENEKVENTQSINYVQVGYNEGSGTKELYLALSMIFIIALSLMLYYGVETKEFNKIKMCDILFMAVAVISCCLLFAQAGDMIITIAHAEDLLNIIGKEGIGSFYDIVLKKAMTGGYGSKTALEAANYNVFLYLILAVLISPVLLISKMLNIECNGTFMIMYFAVVLAIALLYSAYLIYLIAEDMGIGESRARIVWYMYLTSPILLYATVGFLQMDLFYVIFVLHAIRKYMKQQYIRFSLLISIAIMLKSFPILMFIPLVLLVEKRALHIFKYLLIGLSFSLAFGLFYGNDWGYIYTKDKMEEVYGFTKRIFFHGINGGMGTCAFLVLIMVALCIWCFDKNVEDRDLWKYIIIVPLIIYGALIVVIGWHPQWLAIVVPFFCLSIVIYTERRSILYMEWGISLLYCVISMKTYPSNADNYMVNNSILPLITGHKYEGITVGAIIANIANLSEMISSAFSALTICFVFVAAKGIYRMSNVRAAENFPIERGLVYARCATIYLVTLLFLIMYFYVG